MKSLNCNRCGRITEVSDGYQFKSCALCRSKQKARNLKNSEIRKGLRKFDRDARIQLRGLDISKMPPFMHTYSLFARRYEIVWKKSCTWEDYSKALEHFRLRQAQEQGRLEISKRRKEWSQEKSVNEIEFPFKNEDCKTYRLLRAKNARSIDECDFMGFHIYKCKICTAWLEWFKHYQDESDLREGDMSPFDGPNIGADPYNASQKPEENTKYKPLDRDLERSEFDDSKTDFRKIKQKEKENNEKMSKL